MVQVQKLFYSSDGNIVEIDEDESIQSKYSEDDFNRVINAKGMCLLPGKI